MMGNNSSPLQMVVTDLDGTLFQDDRLISKKDLDTLHILGDNNIYRTIATGRNLLSANKALPADLPIDYLIYSSGAGIVNWKTKEHLHSNYLDKDEVKDIADILIQNDIDFMIHEIIPQNHKFVYHRAGKNNDDFEHRIKIYKEYAEPLDLSNEKYANACQLVAIFPNNNLELFQHIKSKFDDIKVIRTTSPLDHHSIWMEIFPVFVSKGHGISWLCNHLGVDIKNTLSVGNDYNDIDMLEFTGHSYVVENSPSELKATFNVCASNMNSGFTDAVSKQYPSL